MTIYDRVRSALRSTRPEAGLRTLVGDLAREGHGKTEIVQALEDFVVQARSSDDFAETDEDAILEVLDALYGWCHPTARLLPD